MLTTEKVDFRSVPWGSVEWTNLVTLYLRACESRTRRPILGDSAAAQAVDRIEYDFKRMHRSALPAANQYLVALRAKQFDNWCADFLQRHPESVVLHLGCGLDGRAFRLGVPPAVQWFDLDQASVINLRRRLYDETEHYRMIGSSVTDPQWIDQIPTGHPTLIIAEGLLMYVPETEVRQLITRLLDRFDGGELQFDTLAAAAPAMSKVFTKGIIKWGIGNARDVQDWHPKLRFVEQSPALAGFEKIDAAPVRWIYRFFNASPFGPYDMLNRFTF